MQQHDVNKFRSKNKQRAMCTSSKKPSIALMCLFKVVWKCS